MIIRSVLPRSRGCLAALAVLCLARAAAADVPQDVQTFLEQHCYACHDSVNRAGGLDLLELELDPTDPRGLATWARVYDRVAAGEMPPAKRPRPPEDAVEAFVDQLREP